MRVRTRVRCVEQSSYLNYGTIINEIESKFTSVNHPIRIDFTIKEYTEKSQFDMDGEYEITLEKIREVTRNPF